jgi:hypothetical protein
MKFAKFILFVKFFGDNIQRFEKSHFVRNGCPTGFIPFAVGFGAILDIHVFMQVS